MKRHKPIWPARPAADLKVDLVARGGLLEWAGWLMNERAAKKEREAKRRLEGRFHLIVNEWVLDAAFCAGVGAGQRAKNLKKVAAVNIEA